jgi:hypothetical protein
MKLFLTEAQLEEWAIAEKADLKDGKLEVAEDGASFPVVPAVHFVKLVSGADEQKLVAKVKTEPQLKSLGAEQMADSVLLGDAAYEVVPGYVTEVAGGAAEAKPSSETELLAQFFLNKM